MNILLSTSSLTKTNFKSLKDVKNISTIDLIQYFMLMYLILKIEHSFQQIKCETSLTLEGETHTLFRTIAVLITSFLFYLCILCFSFFNSCYFIREIASFGSNEFMILYLYLEYSIPPAIRGGYIPPPPENPRFIDAVLKRLCMILYTLKYDSKTHSKVILTH